MFSYSEVTNFIRQPEFAAVVEAAEALALEQHAEIKEQTGLINLLKQAVSSERQMGITGKQRNAIESINLTPIAFFEVLFACALTARVHEAMLALRENREQPRMHGFGDGRHNDPHCQTCLDVHDTKKPAEAAL